MLKLSGITKSYSAGDTKVEAKRGLEVFEDLDD